ncbi:MAG: HD domain-containing protein [Candidatus Hadarchaeota archaeon]
MDREEIVKCTEEFVRDEMGEDPAHDWWHVKRVTDLAIEIGKEEGADLFIVRLAALLHDLEDWKYNDGRTGSERARRWLKDLGVEDRIVSKISHIIENVSFEGAGAESDIGTKEGKVVQDADRLDSLGAIGIARCFSYAGSQGRKIHDPGEPPENHETFEEYRESETTTINHFYEKLLLLKDRINTDTARGMAEERHEFMEKFLERFYDEWDGTR